MLYNKLDNSVRSKWNEQVYLARQAYTMDCIDGRPNYPMINTVMKSVADVVALRVHIAVIPVIAALQALEQQFAAIRKYDAPRTELPKERRSEYEFTSETFYKETRGRG